MNQCQRGHDLDGGGGPCPTCEAGPTPPRAARRKLIDVLVDTVADHAPDSMKPRPGNNWSYDACRFRKNSRCMYPLELDRDGSLEAGYAVWEPTDRGFCPRVSWDAQKKCPMYEPGPKSGDPAARPDATTAWRDGGQRA